MAVSQNNSVSAKRQAVYIANAILMGVMTAAGCLAAVSFGNDFDEESYLRMLIAEIGMLFAFTLFIGCCFSIREDTHQRRSYAAVSILLYICIFLSGAFDILDGTPGLQRQLMALQTVSSLLSVVIHLLIWDYQCAALPESRLRRLCTVLIDCQVTVYSVLIVVNLFTGFLFYVDESGRTHYPGEMIELFNSFLFYTVYLVFILPQRCSLGKKLSLAAFAVFPFFYMLLTLVWYASGLRYTVTAMLYIFLLMAAYVAFLGDYIESRATLLRQKAALAEKEREQTQLQTTLMLSQIRPHFLYNALTAIQDLCQREPVEAERSLGLFADYLRGNMDALGSGRMVPFSKELEHIRAYLTLEQLRFGEDLKVEYDIRFQSFSLPALAVQPIVENAVRHGAVMNENGGVVRICAEQTEDGARITVEDNGPGFNPNAAPSDGRTHYGLSNVRTCLAVTGCGELLIQSTPGVGTTATILINHQEK